MLNTQKFLLYFIIKSLFEINNNIFVNMPKQKKQNVSE